MALENSCVGFKGFFRRSVGLKHLLSDKLGAPLRAVNRIASSTLIRGRLRAEAVDLLLNSICATATTPKLAARVLDRVLRDIVRPHHHAMFWGDRLLTLDKAAEFREDPAFQSALKQADSSTGANNTNPRKVFPGDSIR